MTNDRYAQLTDQELLDNFYSDGKGMGQLFWEQWKPYCHLFPSEKPTERDWRPQADKLLRGE